MNSAKGLRALRSVTAARWLGLLTAALLAALLPAARSGPAEAQMGQAEIDEIVGEARAISGDTIEIGGDDLRLYGIDAPEMGQTCWNARGVPYDCGQASRNIMERLVTGRTLHCSTFDVRVDGTLIGTCRLDSADGMDLGRVMVRGGWAFSDRALSDRYENSEAMAQMAAAGFWSGRAQRPHHWRAEQLNDEMDR